MIHSRKMLNRMGDRRHPCLTPTVVLNHSLRHPMDIGVGRFRILGGPRFRILGAKGGPNSQ